jgi:Bacterial mobilisation protein (MobC)
VLSARTEMEDITVTKPDQATLTDDPTDSNPGGDAAGRSFNVGAGRRERSTTGRRPEVVKLRLTEDERAELAAHAGQRGITVQRYLLECVAAVQAGGSLMETATDRREDMAALLGVRRLLANVANNVNQIARAANAGALPSHGESSAAFDAAKRASDRIYEVVNGMLPPRR